MKYELEQSYYRLNYKIGVYLLHRDDYDYENSKKNTLRAPNSTRTILSAMNRNDMKQFYYNLGVSNWTNNRMNKV